MAKGFEIPGLGDLMEQATAMQERLARTLPLAVEPQHPAEPAT